MELESGRLPRTRPYQERFWEKVCESGSEGCWLWTATTDRKGYGQFTPTHNHKVLAHRFAWFLVFGAYPIGLLCHRCDIPLCVNPSHMFVGTQSDNLRDMVAKDRHHNNHKLSVEEASEIFSLRGKATQSTIAKKFGVAQSMISRIHLGKAWSNRIKILGILSGD